MDKLKQEVMEYVAELERKNKSQNTIDTYKSQLLTLGADLNLTTWYNLTEDILKQYIQSVEEKALKENNIKSLRTLNYKLTILQAYLDTTTINVNPKEYKVKVVQEMKDKLELKEVNKLLYYADQAGDIRTVTIIKTLLLTGARISELLQMQATDINKKQIVIKGKGSKMRTLYLPKALQKQLKEYGKVRQNTSPYLFTGRQGAISRKTVDNDLKKYARLSKMSKAKQELVHAHSFRHLYAQLCTQIGIPYSNIQDLLGHSLTITQHYTSWGKAQVLKALELLDKELNKYPYVPVKNRKK